MPISRIAGRLGAAVALALGLGLAPAAAEDSFERAGDFLMVALPAAAGVCALADGRGGDFVAGLATTQLVTRGGKLATQDMQIGQRPNGGRLGFPSGHTSMAMFGATNLAKGCFEDQPGLGLLAYGTAALVGASRIHADKHTLTQVVAGALVGYYANGVRLDLSGDGAGISYSMQF